MLTIDLFPYQSRDVDIMVQRGSMLVAYQMGLGKTTMSIAAIEQLLGEEKIDMAVIVCGASLKYQWAKRIASATDVKSRSVTIAGQTITIPEEEFCIVVDGTPKQRERQYEQAIDTRPDYILLSYEQVVGDWQYVRRLQPGCIVLDEATAIKSFRAQRTRRIKRFVADYRYALTGTPVENGKPEELFSIMQWVDSSILGRYDIFDKTYIVRNHFGGVNYYKNLRLFHERMSEVMCRRTRLDPEVLPYLPSAQWDELPVDIDSKTMKVYKYIIKQLYLDLCMVEGHSTFDLASIYGAGYNEDHSQQGKIAAKMQAAIMLSNEPRLVARSAELYAKGEGEGSKFCADLVDRSLLTGLPTSRKLQMMVSEIRDILEQDLNNKVIVFSFYKGMLPIIQQELSEFGSVLFTGDMNVKEKGAAQAKFESDPTIRLFLSSHAGGFGVDLPAANYLYHYEPPLSSGKFDQHSFRHIRAGSGHSSVFIRSVLAQGTLDNWLYDRVGFKQTVQSAIIDNTGADKTGRVENAVPGLKSWIESSGLL